MADHSKPEWHLMMPVAAMLLFPVICYKIGWDAIDSSMFIIAIPLVVWPAIAIIGQVWKKTDWWKNHLKEGGIIALAALAVSLCLTIWLIIQFLGEHGNFGAQDSDIASFAWLNFDILAHDGVSWELIGSDKLGFTIGFGIYVDALTLMLLFVAAFLCFLIGWFAIGYMTTDAVNEDRNHRFFAEFLLFSCGMFGMVLADNFLWLFIFWEIMGLCSYLLIGFYWEKPSAVAAAKKAFMTTRVGDVFLMVGLLIIYDLYNSLSFEVIFDPAIIDTVDPERLRLALIMLFIGAVGKSAQFPLHVWLPDAMEGPTPVSALIHAATMVNAGLYLVARMFPFFGASGFEGDFSDVALLITWIGGITAIMAAAIALVANDIKRVLAYSTMSQLAYIFAGLGAACWFANSGHPEFAALAFGAALFHLFNHAMAKGMLFMASGSVIHEMHHAHHQAHGEHGGGDDDHFDAQDMRNMGGLASKMPVTSVAMMLGSMSIIGIPLIGGFWSKEGIIGQAWHAAISQDGGAMLVPALLLLATAGMTGFYMSRMWFMTFAGKPKTDVAEHVGEDTHWIKTPLVTLSLVTAFTGAIFAVLNFPEWLGEGEQLMHGIESHGLAEQVVHVLEHTFLPHESTLLAVGWTAIVISAILGPFLAARIHGGRLAAGEEANPFVGWLVQISGSVGRTNVDEIAKSGFAVALHNRLYIDDLYEWVIARTVVPLGNLLAWFDKSGIDGVIKGIESGSQASSSWIRLMTTGSARDYILMAAVGALCIFALLWGMA